MFAAAIEADVPVQPVMIRYMRDGGHYTGMTFLRGEGFLANIFRLLGQRRCIAEVAILPLIYPAGKQRRELAKESEVAVTVAFESGISSNVVKSAYG